MEKNNIIESNELFTLEDITDTSMGLIQNSCWSNSPDTIKVEWLEISKKFKNII